MKCPTYEEIGRKIANEALDNFSIDGLTVRQWVNKIARGEYQEVKHAHWIDYYEEVEIYNAGGFTEKRKIGVKCSGCQWINRWYAGNYCGNCGAKMDGDE